jgi:hypothetical protein
VIHLVCDCGALVSASPLPGATTATCGACGRAREIPDPAGLGLEAVRPRPLPAGDLPGPAPVPQHPGGAAFDIPTFDSDERLDLFALEREAVRLQFVGRLVLVAGFLGAAAAAAIPGRTPAERALLAAVALFGAVAGWCGFRAARASCLASVALAQRQREILRGMVRG